MAELQIVALQPNFLAGDVAGNTKKIIAEVENTNADLVIFPELALVGGVMNDLIYRPAFQKALTGALETIKKTCFDQYVVIGYPRLEQGVCYNSAVVFHQGQQILNVDKTILKSRSLAHDTAYFCPAPADQARSFKVLERVVSLVFDTQEPVNNASDIVIQLRADHFVIGRQQTIEKQALELARRVHAFVYSMNHAGGQDERVFSGASFIATSKGQISQRAPSFVESKLQSAGAVLEPLGDEIARTYQALVVSVQDYVEKNGFKTVLLGASGGIDSALLMAIAADAVGGENVHAITMPSQYSASFSAQDAKTQAQCLGVRFDTIAVEPLYQSFMQALEPIFLHRPIDTAEENLQARVRGTLLMAVSNKFGALVLVPSNKSEVAVGYSTLYGDMNGGFAPLKDIYKTTVYKLARYRNSQSQVIPERAITREPSAELRCGQLDSDSLPSYDVLDPILQAYIEQDLSSEAIISQGFATDIVERVARLVRMNEYKRQQSAIGPQVTEVGFSSARYLPVTGQWQNY